MIDAVIIGLLVGTLVALFIFAVYQNGKNNAFNEGIKGKASRTDVDNLKKELDKIEANQEKLREDLPNMIANAISPTHEKMCLRLDHVAEMVSKYESNTSRDVRDIKKFLLKE